MFAYTVLGLTAFVVLLSFDTPNGHFIAPPEYCLLADLCNHTWIPQCGINNESNLYTFLDDCHRLEYNCDNNKDYEVTKMKECETKPTKATTTIIPHAVHNCTRPGELIIPNNCNCSTQTTASMTTIDDTTATTEPTTTTKATTTTESTTTTKATATNEPTSTSTEATSTTKPTTTTEATTKNTQVTTSTALQTTTISKATNSTTANAILSTTANDSTSKSTISNINENTIPQNVVSQPSIFKPCKDCVPLNTWETTANGEVRDFFQILRERFGAQNVKLLRATTHWPRRARWSKNYNSFVLGSHVDT